MAASGGEGPKSRVTKKKLQKSTSEGRSFAFQNREGKEKTDRPSVTSAPPQRRRGWLELGGKKTSQPHQAQRKGTHGGKDGHGHGSEEIL